MGQTRIIMALLVLIVGAGDIRVAVRDGYFGPVAGTDGTTSQVRIGGPFELIDHWGERVTEAPCQGTSLMDGSGAACFSHDTEARAMADKIRRWP